ALYLLEQLSQSPADSATPLTPEQARMRDLLIRLYRDYSREQYAAPSLSAADKQRLRQELDWHGDLALAPAQRPDPAAREAVLAPAQRTLLAFIAVFGLIGLLGLGGAVGLVLMVALLHGRRLRGGVACSSGHGGLYAETFAVWLVLAVLLHLAVVW